jgi:hypothetical protein
MPDEHKPKGNPAPVQLSPALLEDLRRALAVYAGPRAEDGDIRRALRAIAEEARRRGVHAEQLVVSLKRVFEMLTPPPTLASADERARRLSHLVTVCVQEYYSAPDDSGPAGPAGPAGSH